MAKLVIGTEGEPVWVSQLQENNLREQGMTFGGDGVRFIPVDESMTPWLSQLSSRDNFDRGAAAMSVFGFIRDLERMPYQEADTKTVIDFLYEQIQNAAVGHR